MQKIQLKTVRISTELDVKLKQLVESENAKYINTGHSKISENQVINDAIFYYHASKFGKDIFQQETERMQEIMANVVGLVMRTYFDQLAAALNHLSTESAYLKTASNLLLADSNMFGNKATGDIDKALNNKWKYEDDLMRITIEKREEE